MKSIGGISIATPGTGGMPGILVTPRTEIGKPLEPEHSDPKGQAGPTSPGRASRMKAPLSRSVGTQSLRPSLSGNATPAQVHSPLPQTGSRITSDHVNGRRSFLASSRITVIQISRSSSVVGIARSTAPPVPDLNRCDQPSLQGCSPREATHKSATLRVFHINVF